mmetsp:Transcript_72903/g.235720  ORF Transcript_72903/g.235720 Transcript_72903/m.235720 type:complete len:333 (-) Transcript_72903:655-1653(-)
MLEPLGVLQAPASDLGELLGEGGGLLAQCLGLPLALDHLGLRLGETLGGNRLLFLSGSQVGLCGLVLFLEVVAGRLQGVQLFLQVLLLQLGHPQLLLPLLLLLHETHVPPLQAVQVVAAIACCLRHVAHRRGHLAVDAHGLLVLLLVGLRAALPLLQLLEGHMGTHDIVQHTLDISDLVLSCAQVRLESFNVLLVPSHARPEVFEFKALDFGTTLELRQGFLSDVPFSLELLTTSLRGHQLLQELARIGLGPLRLRQTLRGHLLGLHRPGVHPGHVLVLLPQRVHGLLELLPQARRLAALADLAVFQLGLQRAHSLQQAVKLGLRLPGIFLG